MDEYLINTGEFNVIVRPHAREFYILGDDPASLQLQRSFVQGREVSYEGLRPSWFKYEHDEAWETFDKQQFKLGVNFQENDLIDQFVLKKFNYGGIVAVREHEKGKTKIFKRDKL